MKAWLTLPMLLTLLLGCSKPQSSIVGTWSFDHAPAGVDAATKFNADGTYEDWFRGTRINTTSKGIYKVTGDQLTQTQTESTLTSGQKNGGHTTSQVRVRWLSSDHIELSAPEDTATYTRRVTSN
jgi:hypothetical protein